MNHQNKKAVWLMRHKPTKPQRRVLEDRGYNVIVPKHLPDRFHNAQDVWMQAQIAAGGIPAVCVVKMPLGMLKVFIRMYGDQTTILHAPARKVGDGVHDWEWTGVMERVKAVRVISERWA